ncbi:NAD(P)/FAD-dependent oxidoreductase [Streptomyces sp. TRM70308]|uniref:NAD(P)/FAD-dependent oxidoreductase n=1 Tax=Streptomyces sp. TRM70308 TaxID=3131932 RepID=UPI003D02750C
MSSNDALYDAVVVGAGAGGSNAALVLARSRRRIAVVDSGTPRNAPSAHLHGFLSRDGMAPRALLDAGHGELARYGAELITDEAVAVEPGFRVRLAGGAVLAARRLVVATGLRDELPDLPGLRERWGRDVLHCPYCHGYEVRDRPLGVLGTSPAAPEQALLVRQWSRDVVLFAHTLSLTDAQRERLTARGVHIAEGTVERLVVEDDRLRGVELAQGRGIPRDAVFVAPRMVPRDELLTSLGCVRAEDGFVPTDRTGRTRVPGVWAVGNVVDPRALVAGSAGMGSAAAFALNHDLVEEDVERAVEEHRTPEVPPALVPGAVW